MLPFGPGSPDGWKPRTEAPRLGGGRRDVEQRAAAQRAVADDAAAADEPAPDLELRLDERERVEARRRAGEHRPEHGAQRDERDVGHDHLGSVGQRARARRLRALKRSITVTRGIAAQPPAELAVGDVERDDVRGARPRAGSR